MHKKLYGLVLAGGKSTRMGEDKGLMEWHGKAQRYHAADLLAEYCDDVYLSCRPDQVAEILKSGYKVYPDESGVVGQYGALITAFSNEPEVAFLVVACDMPFLDARALSFLVNSRDSNLYATAYKNPDNGMPEPLAAIWEPISKKMLINNLSKEISCPRKALMSVISDVKLIEPEFTTSIMNVNTPEHANKAKKLADKQ